MTYPPLSKADVARLSGPGLRTFFNIAGEWRLDETAQMGILGTDDTVLFERWRTGDYDGVTDETLIRLSFLFGIYRWAHELIGSPEQTSQWLNQPHADPAFLGRSPLQWIADGKLETLHDLRHLLMVSAIARD